MHRQQIKKSLEQELDETLKPPVVSIFALFHLEIDKHVSTDYP